MFNFIQSVFLLGLTSDLCSGKIIQLEPNLQPESLKDLVDDNIVKPIKTRHLLESNIRRFENPESGDTSNGSKPVGNRTVAIGTEGDIYHDGYDKGFFSTIFRAYAFHWSLKTQPDDWWFTILRNIAIAVDKNSKNPEIRNFFVSHEGKKRLVVHVSSLVGTDYNWFFGQMTDKVKENINRPDYVDLARNDFSTTTNQHLLVSNVAIMSSVQEYFEYVLAIECGIPQIEMAGTLADWANLLQKFQDMEKLLEPIKEILMPESWWSSVKVVLVNLIKTYAESRDSEFNAQDWWSNLIESFGGCGGPPSFSGWFMRDFLGVYNLESAPLGIVTVPLTIDDNGKESQAAVAAGIAGFTVEETNNNVTWIEANYVWGLMLDPQSYLREGLV